MALDIPASRTAGQTWTASDYNKIRASLAAVAPRVLQPAPLRLYGAGTLNTYIGSDHFWHTITYVGNTTSLGVVGFEFLLPADFVTLQKAVIRCVDYTTSGNLRYEVYAAYSEPGEAVDAHDNAISVTTLALTANVQSEINIASVFSGIPANALVGLTFTRRGDDVLDTCGAFFGVFCLDIEYTP